MCVSDLRRVIAAPENEAVRVEDRKGRTSLVSLLAYDGAPLAVGTWLVVHSGFALASLSTAEALASIAEIEKEELLRRQSEEH